MCPVREEILDKVKFNGSICPSYACSWISRCYVSNRQVIKCPVCILHISDYVVVLISFPSSNVEELAHMVTHRTIAFQCLLDSSNSNESAAFICLMNTMYGYYYS